MNNELKNIINKYFIIIIDEVSMMGKSLLLKISNNLQIARNNHEPFGNINIVFVGDFYQLPHVRDPPIYKIKDTNITLDKLWIMEKLEKKLLKRCQSNKDLIQQMNYFSQQSNLLISNLFLF